MGQGESTASRRWGGRADAAVLVAVVLFPAAFYVPGLRFYLDDWGFWTLLRDSADQSTAGLYRSLNGNVELSLRPGQIAWLILCYQLWPYHAWPIHLVNHLLFGAGVLVLHAGLRDIQRWRAAAFPIVLVYACLGSFTATRMWWATHQATLSWLFFALALWIVVRAAHSARRMAYAGAILAAGAASALCYELFAPLVPLLPAFVWWGQGRSAREMVAAGRFLLLTASAAAGIVLATCFKVWMSIGIGLGALAKGRHEPIAYGLEVVRMYGAVARDTLGTAGLFSPVAAVRLAVGPGIDAGAAIAAAAVLAVLLARFRPWHLQPLAPARHLSPLAVAAIGAAVFVLGYAAFVPNLLYLPGAWGPNSRQNAAAALGGAMLAYAACLGLGQRWPRIARWSLVILCVAGVFLQVSIGRLWVRAAGEQRRVVEQIKTVAPRLAPRRVLLVYGLCPYLGVAPVFPYRGWDLTHALHLSGLPRLEADILTLGTELDPLGIVVPDAESHYRRRYRYGSFEVLDRSLGTVTPIDDAPAAHRYFAARSLALPTGCRYSKGAGAALY